MNETSVTVVFISNAVCKFSRIMKKYVPKKKVLLRKIPKFHLISWCGIFAKTQSFGRGLIVELKFGDDP